MAQPPFIELGQGWGLTRIRILHEDRSVIALDKPAGWMLVPFSWQRTRRNLQAAITSSIAAGDFWARSRNLKFLRHVHRLDAETTGVLLFAKSAGAVMTYSDLFESRQMAKSYLAVVEGVPAQAEWTCSARLGPDPKRIGRVRVDTRHGKEAETRFRVLQTTGRRSLLEARPITGRTHQIRVHLLEAGYPVLGDSLYGQSKSQIPNSQSPVPSAQFAIPYPQHPIPNVQNPWRTPGNGPPPITGIRNRPRDSSMPSAAASALRMPSEFPLGLRAVGLAYFDPFLRRRVNIRAPIEGFVEAFGFSGEKKDIP